MPPVSTNKDLNIIRSRKRRTSIKKLSIKCLWMSSLIKRGRKIARPRVSTVRGHAILNSTPLFRTIKETENWFTPRSIILLMPRSILSKSLRNWMLRSSRRLSMQTVMSKDLVHALANKNCLQIIQGHRIRFRWRAKSWTVILAEFRVINQSQRIILL